MAIVQVQKKNYTSTASNTAHSVVFGATPTQNNLLILCMASDEPFTIANVPAGWSQADTAADFPNGAIYYKIAGASESATINVTLPNTNCCILEAFEYSGMATVSPLDQHTTAVNQNSAGTMNPGTTSTTTQADELVIVLFVIDNTNAITFNSYTNSYVEESDTRTTTSAVNIAAATASLIVSSTGTQTTTVTTSAAGTSNDIGIIATFKMALAVGVPVAWFTA